MSIYLINHFRQLKKDQKKITVVTSYDYYTAKIINKTHVDGILVGDCSSMVMHGERNTIFSDVNILALHVKWVAKGAPDKLIIAAMPFMSVKKGLSQALSNIELLMKSGAQAVKIEDPDGNEEVFLSLSKSGIPVIGHIGLMPSRHYMEGGFKPQGKTMKDAHHIVDQAKKLEDLGSLCIVLEAVPPQVGKMVSEAVTIPVIGVGAGVHVDGQALVLQDLLGLITDFKPKFVRTYLDGASLFTNAINHFVKDVHHSDFPSEKEEYHSEILEQAEAAHHLGKK